MNRKWHELDRQSDTELFLLADVEGLASPAQNVCTRYFPAVQWRIVIGELL